MSGKTINDSGDQVCEVEFSVRDSRYPFVGLSEAEACTLDLAEMFPRHDEGYAEFFTVDGAEPGRIESRARSYDGVDVTLLAEYGDGGFLEFVVTGDCPVLRLTALGAIPIDVRGHEGAGRVIVEIPPGRESAEIVGSFLDAYPAFELVSKRGKDSIAPRFTRSAYHQLLHCHLTDRQREVLGTALEAGYYEWPRRCTGTEVAERLDITSATFSEHVTVAERKLLTALFEGPDLGPPGGR